MIYLFYYILSVVLALFAGKYWNRVLQYFGRKTTYDSAPPMIMCIAPWVNIFVLIIFVLFITLLSIRKGLQILGIPERFISLDDWYNNK